VISISCVTDITEDNDMMLYKLSTYKTVARVESQMQRTLFTDRDDAFPQLSTLQILIKHV